MTTTVKSFRIISLIIFVLLSSCEKSKDNFKGLFIDNELIGEWGKSYSIRDSDNGITLFTDSISFNTDNSGTWTKYKFRELDSKDSFDFYTDGNLLHIKFSKTETHDIWTYKIQSDSLTIENSIFKR